MDDYPQRREGAGGCVDWPASVGRVVGGAAADQGAVREAVRGLRRGRAADAVPREHHEDAADARGEAPDDVLARVIIKFLRMDSDQVLRCRRLIGGRRGGK